MIKGAKKKRIEDYISELDSVRFGFKVARLDDITEDFKDTILELNKLNVKLIIIRINSTEIQTINELEHYGFRLKDTQMLLKHELEHFYQIQQNTLNELGLSFREAKTEEAKKIAQLAGKSFDGYGHYGENKQLPKNKIAEIYYDWAYRSCLDKTVADKVIVAEIENEIVGFTSIKYHQNSEQPFSFLNVGAIDNKHRNKGIFRLLINQCLISSKEDNMGWADTKIRTVNIPVNRSLNNLGFKFNGSEHTLHYWNS